MWGHVVGLGDGLLAFNGGLMQRLLGLEEYLMVFGVKLQFTS